MECRTEKLINSHFKNEAERDKFYKEIASRDTVIRDTVIRDTYFRLGFIAAVNFMRELEKCGQELKKKADFAGIGKPEQPEHRPPRSIGSLNCFNFGL